MRVFQALMAVCLFSVAVNARTVSVDKEGAKVEVIQDSPAKEEVVQVCAAEARDEATRNAEMMIGFHLLGFIFISNGWVCTYRLSILCETRCN